MTIGPDQPVNTDALNATLQYMYGDIGMSDEAFDALIDQSLDPRGPEMLFDRMAELGLSNADQVLDAGCRDARHSIVLAQRFGCSVLGIDPVSYNIARAKQAIAEHDLAQRVRVEEGRIEAIPAPDAHFAFIWCRDVLTHVPDLRAAFAECARVLKPGGRMLVYQTFATELLEPREAARLYPDLAVVSANMSPDYVEQAAQDVGLRITDRDIIGSEWRERWEEDGVSTTSRQLLRIARMRRNREQLVTALGQQVYANELANCHWGVYQMLGKLCPRVYVLAKS